jgi:hypothetical protein
MTTHEHLGLDALLDYWLGELDPAREAAVDNHLLACDGCGAQLDGIISLSQAVRDTFEAGTVHAFVSDAFVRRLEECGVQVREYRVPRNGSVNCTILPGDQLLVARMEAPLEGVTRVDAIRDGEGGTMVFRDVPFDPAAGVVLLVPRTETIRAMPSHRARVRLIAVEGTQERELGQYTFDHSRPG